MENIIEFLKKLKIELPYDPEIPLLGKYPKELKAECQRYLYTHVHSSIKQSLKGGELRTTTHC